MTDSFLSRLQLSTFYFTTVFRLQFTYEAGVDNKRILARRIDYFVKVFSILYIQWRAHNLNLKARHVLKIMICCEILCKIHFQ